MGIVLFVTGNLAAIVIATALVDLLNVREDRWLRATAGLVLYGAVIVAVLLIAGLTGMLRPWIPVVLLSVLAILCRVAVARAQRLRPDGQPPPQHELPVGLLMRLFVALTVGLSAAMLARLFFGPTGFTSADLIFHAPVVAEWMQQGNFAAAFTFRAYMPQNAELLCLWFALPLGSDALVSLASAWWLVLLLVAATALARQLGARGWLQALPALGLLLSGQVMMQVTSFAPIALGEAALIVAAIALVAPALREEADVLGAITCAGLAAGLAVGTTSAALAPVALLVVVAPAWVACRRRLREAAQAFALLLLTTALMGGYWYVRAMALTGNPFYPARFASFDGPLSTTPAWDAPISMVSTYLLDWPLSLAVLALIGYGVGIAAVRRLSENAALRVLPIVIGAGIVGAVIGPMMPMGRTVYPPPFITDTPVDLWLTPFALGLVLLGVTWRVRANWLAPLAAVLLGLAAYSALSGNAPHELRTFMMAGLTLGAVGAIWWHAVRRRIWIPTTRQRTVFALTVAILIVIGAWAPMKQRLTDADLLAEPGIGAGWYAVNELPAGSRIAWLGLPEYRYYPFYGREYQLDPVPVFDDGSPWAPVHLHQRKHRFNAWVPPVHPPTGMRFPFTASRDLPMLVENLQDQRIEYVFATTPLSDLWPPGPQVQALTVSDDAVVIYDDGSNTIWRIRDGTTTDRSGEDTP